MGVVSGVSHMVVPSDVEGVLAICEWLSYVPCCQNSPLPVLPSVDPVDRPIKFKPTKAPYDPRFMLAGRDVESELSFFFFKFYPAFSDASLLICHCYDSCMFKRSGIIKFKKKDFYPFC